MTNITSALLSTHALRTPSWILSCYTELSPRCFSRTITRRPTLSTTAHDTNNTTLFIRFRRPAPLLQAPTKSARVVPWTPVARRALHPYRFHL